MFPLCGPSVQPFTLAVPTTFLTWNWLRYNQYEPPACKKYEDGISI